MPRCGGVYSNDIGVLGVLVLLFDVVLWVVGACFLICFDRLCLVFGWCVFCWFVFGRGFPWVPPKH